jgi:hypothetical protein
MMLAVEMEYFWHLDLNSGLLDRPIGANCKPLFKTTSGLTYVIADPTLRTRSDLISSTYGDEENVCAYGCMELF